MRALPNSRFQSFKPSVSAMITSYKQASTRKRHDAIVVMPACLWAVCEVFGST